jgi:hypothetical protein
MTLRRLGYDNKDDGRQVTLAEHWDGRSWLIHPAAVASSGTTFATLNSVSCVSPTDCTAVGWYLSGPQSLVLVERWDGRDWTIEPFPEQGFDWGSWKVFRARRPLLAWLWVLRRLTYR